MALGLTSRGPGSRRKAGEAGRKEEAFLCLLEICHSFSCWVSDAASKVTEQEWREKAKKDLEEWNQRQSEQVEKNKINNR
jgi:hypothetical protein